MTIEEKVIANLKYAIRWNDKPTQKSMEVAIASLEAWEKVKAEIEDHMKRKWEQLSDSDKVMVTGVTTIDDWKYHMAESTLDIINRHLQEVEE